MPRGQTQDHAWCRVQVMWRSAVGPRGRSFHCSRMWTEDQWIKIVGKQLYPHPTAELLIIKAQTGRNLNWQRESAALKANAKSFTGKRAWRHLNLNTLPPGARRAAFRSWSRTGGVLGRGGKCALQERQALIQFASEKLAKVKCPEPNWQGPVCTHKRRPGPVEVHRSSSEASTSCPFPLLPALPSFFSPSLLPSFPSLHCFLSSDKHLLCARPYPKPKVTVVHRMYSLYHQETCKLVREAKQIYACNSWKCSERNRQRALKEICREN